jgi:hypothetical protein
MSEPLIGEGNRQATADWFALVGIVVTVALHLALQSQKPNPVFIACACLFWGAFVVAKGVLRPGVFREWGFRADNLMRASAFPAALFAAAALALAAYAWWHGSFWLPPHAAWLFLLYPVWGLAQQFLALGVAVQNLELVPAVRQRRWLLALLGAALFGAVHAPDWWVVVATFLLELVLVPVFLHWRNLWPLGVLHGWLGVLFYHWALGRDVLAEGFR